MAQETTDPLDGVHEALNRMGRAARRGTGCYLTAEMIAALRVSSLGQAMDEAAPQKEIGNAR